MDSIQQQIELIHARTIEDAALLRLFGFSYEGGFYDPHTRRVVLQFSGDLDAGRQLLIDAARDGVDVNSLMFIDALTWAKNRIFSERRAAGER